MDICGIYKIENQINHKIYIGQSINIHKRWREHKSGAFNTNNKDYNMVIYQAFRKYGLENFSFEIIEECSAENLNEKEVYWIKYYNSYKEGYNATEGGDESHIHLGKPVEVYDYNGQYVTEYPNITEAAKDIGVSRYTIYSILYGKRLSTKGFQFKLKEDTQKVIKPYTNKQGGKLAVNQYTKQGQFIQTWESATKAGRDLEIDPSSITKCLKGKLKSTGGYIWKYAKEGDIE